MFFTSQLHIDSHHDPTSPTKEEVDFFKEHVDITDSNPLSDNQKLFSASEPQPIKNGNLKKEEFGRTWLNSTGFLVDYDPLLFVFDILQDLLLWTI